MSLDYKILYPYGKEAVQKISIKEKKNKLLCQIVTTIKGKILGSVINHLVSRVIQLVFKYGSKEDCRSITSECNLVLFKLTKNPSGHFIVKQIISLANKRQQEALYSEFSGNICELLRHPFSFVIVNEFYSVSEPSKKRAMIAEFYGFENTVKTTNETFDHLIEYHVYEKNFFLSKIAKRLTPILVRGLIKPHIIHRVLIEYLSNVSYHAILDIYKSLDGPILLTLITTNAGINVVSKIYSALNTKERKKIVKGLKEYVIKFTRNRIGYFFFIKLLTIEDSKYMKLFISFEFNKNLTKIVWSRWGVQLLLKFINFYNLRIYIEVESIFQIRFFDRKPINSREHYFQEIDYDNYFEHIKKLISKFFYFMDQLIFNKYNLLIILYFIEQLVEKRKFGHLINQYTLELNLFQKEITETTYQSIKIHDYFGFQVYMVLIIHISNKSCKEKQFWKELAKELRWKIQLEVLQ